MVIVGVGAWVGIEVTSGIGVGEGVGVGDGISDAAALMLKTIAITAKITKTLKDSFFIFFFYLLFRYIIPYL
jgi:hypothetical protein